MSTFEVVELPLVIDRADLIGIKVRIVLSICDSGIFTPRSFPQFVKHSEILISLKVTLVVLNGCVDAYGFERRFLPTGYDVPSIKVRKSVTHFLYYMVHCYEAFALTRYDPL